METNCLYKIANNVLLKEVNIKNYYLDDQININQKSYTDILIYYLRLKLSIVKKLQIIFNMI